MLGQVLVISGVVFCCGYGWHRYQRNQWERRNAAWRDSAETRQRLDACMDGVWSEPRPLIADIDGELVGPAKVAAKTQAGRVMEVSLTPQAQRNAWISASYLAHEGATEDRESAIRLILQNNVAPGCDWSGGYAPYGHDARFRDVYESVGLVLDLAELSMKYGSEASGGALVAPGWVHKNPAPSADVRAGDYVEVMVDRFSDDPRDDCRYAEWAWIRVDSSQRDAVTGTVTFDAPPGAQANPLRNGESHGFIAGAPITVPRRCIHRVIHGR